MCSGSKSKLSSSDCAMEDKLQKGIYNSSILLELAASDDFDAFKREVDEKGLDVNEEGFWDGRRIGSKMMESEKRTPLMIASLFGSTRVVEYIISTGKIDVNGVCGSDMATALHCAVAGGSEFSLEVVKLLLDAGADADCLDASGNKPVDLIAPAFNSSSKSRRKVLEMFLRGEVSAELIQGEMDAPFSLKKEGGDKKEFPIDISLPDINNGVYGSDEFRMYSFKVMPCSRAYSHDWTECPFVHPGENARRRDPRKYPYSCVPCPEFRKGSCQKGDSCEYAHGVFESWLHPAQYRTRLCKDETGCNRKVCFFAHRPEDLRPVYASTGSAMPSPKSYSASGIDMTSMSPLSLSSSSLPMSTVSTPPMSPLAGSSSPKSGNMWQNKLNLTPPSLQLPGSRLKSALSARDLDLEMELLGLDSPRRQQQQQQQQQLIEEIARISSPSYRNSEFNRIADLNPTNLDDLLASADPNLLSQLHGLSMQPSTPTQQMHSPSAMQMRQNMNHLRASYPSNNMPSSPVRKPSPYGFDSSAAVAAAVMNSRSAAFAKQRSQSFIDRGAATHHLGLSPPSNPSCRVSSGLSDWGSPTGELLGLDSPRRQQQQQQQQQQLIEEIARISSPSFRNSEFNRIADLNPTNLDDLLASADPNLLSQLHGLSIQPSTPTQQMHSPSAMQMRQNMNHLRASYPSNNMPSSPVRKPSPYGFDSSAAVAAAVMNSRSAAFAKQRSQSFIDRGAATHHLGLSPPSNPSCRVSSGLSDWGSPTGKLDWGVNGDELNKLRKSASFGFRNNGPTAPTASQHTEPDVSWVNSLVKDVPSENSGVYGAENMRQLQQYDLSRDVLPPWVEQMYKEQEQMVA